MDLWLPDRTVIRPPGLSRRGFLRALGVTAASVAVPGLAVRAVLRISAEDARELFPLPRRIDVEGKPLSVYSFWTPRDGTLDIAWTKMDHRKWVVSD